MLEILVIAYLLSGVLHAAFYLLQIRDQVEILEKSKSRDHKILAKQKVERNKSEITLCIIWPYLVYMGARDLIKYQNSLR